MNLKFYQQNQAAVEAALKKGERPEMATTTSRTWLDDLVGLHERLGVFAALEQLPVARQRQGVSDSLLLKTLAVLPFLEQPSLAAASGLLFGEPAILLRLGWSAEQIAWGDNFRHRGAGSLRSAASLPCHADTLRDELRRIDSNDWDQLQHQYTTQLYQHGLVRGRTFAIDGTGLDDGVRLVCLVCVSMQQPLIVAWRLLEGDASEKGKEAAVTRSLIEQVVAAGGQGCIELLLMDALYADGPLLAWLKYQQRIDAIVPLPSDRNMHADLLGLAKSGIMPLKRHSYVATLQGHKQRRDLEIGARDGLTSWDSFIAVAKSYGANEPCLWGCLIRETVPPAEQIVITNNVPHNDIQNNDAKQNEVKQVDPKQPDAPKSSPAGKTICWSLVSTRYWPTGFAAFQEYRQRWHIENDGNRELKEGWQLEAQLWGRDFATQFGRVMLTLLCFNTVQILLSGAGKRLAACGIRTLQRTFSRQLGHSPVVIYFAAWFAVFHVEELLTILGQSPQQSLLPLGGYARPPP